MVESQPSKLLVAGSSPVSRSQRIKKTDERQRPLLSFFLQKNADVAQLVEHILGKDEVTGSIPVVSSRKEKKKNITRLQNERYYHT